MTALSPIEAVAYIWVIFLAGFLLGALLTHAHTRDIPARPSVRLLDAVTPVDHDGWTADEVTA